jgi:DNA processing protein
VPTEDLPPQAYAAALASVPALRTDYLRSLLATMPPAAAWASVVAGGPWAVAARRVDVAATWQAHREAGVEVLVPGDGRYPRVLAGEPGAPAVLFALGDPRVVDRHPRVAVVGTRGATRYGLGVAAQLGAELAGAGVAVVSGLALGIDGAAHEGATGARRAAGGSAGPPVAVVPRALDEPYPRAHGRLWERVAATGAVLSDVPVGTDVPRWRFPHRNRIMAALADVVVVVECHVAGGSLHTVRAAVRRGRSVGAVPGSIRSPASAGTNDLLADGCFVVRDAADVLVALGLARAGAVPVRGRRRSRRGAGSPAVAAVAAVGGDPAGDAAAGVPGQQPGEAGEVAEAAGTGQQGDAPPAADAGEAGDGESVDRTVLRALEWEPCSLEELLQRTGLALAPVAASLERLRSQGRVHGRAGWWEAV